MNSRLSLLEESGIRKYMEYAKRDSKLIDFTIGDTCFDTDKQIKYAVIESLVNNQTHYNSTFGDIELRSLIVSKSYFKYNTNEVLITFGATEGLYCAISAILNEKDEVIIMKPYYSLYKNVVLWNGGVPIIVEAQEEVSIEELKMKLSSKTKAIILNIPCNPTGSVYADSLSQVVELAKEYDLWVILDATYEAIVYDGVQVDYSVYAPIYNKLIIVKSFSKGNAMTGFRVGYVLAKEYIMKDIAKIHQMCVSCPTTFLADACMLAVSEDISCKVKEYEKRRNYVCEQLEESGVSYIKPQGAFYVCIRVPEILSSTEYADKLINEAKIVVVPGIYFGDYSIVRLSYSMSWDKLIEGMNRFKAYSLSSSK